MNRRRIIYIDHLLQKWLLVAMVALEAALTALAIFGLYWVLSGIIDDNLYRIHLSDSESMLRRFIIEGTIVLAGAGVVNLTALIVADRVWAYYVRGILRGLDRVMHAAHALDFAPQAGVKRTHAVLDRALRWQRAQALRTRRIRLALRQLPTTLPQDAGARKNAIRQLKVIQDRGCNALED